MAISTNLLGEGAGTITAGQRRFSALASARLIPQVIEKLYYLNANVAPLSVLIEKLGKKKSVGQPSFYHFESDELPTTLGVSGSQTSGDTAIEVESGHGKRARVNDRLYNTRTEEEVIVTAVNTDTLTCTRGANGTTAAAMNDSDELKMFGLQDTDGNTAPDGIHSEPTQVTNACQIFKETCALSGRDINAANYGDSEKVRVMRDSNARLLRQKEMAYMFGKGITTSGQTATKGVNGWLSTNLTNLSGSALDEANLNSFIKSVYRRNQDGSELTFIAGENIREALDSFGRDNVRFDPNDKVAGMKVGRYQNSFGSLTIVPHGMLSDTIGSGASLGRWGGIGWLLNMKHLGKATYSGRDLNLYSDQETPGTDGKKWQWLEDSGLWVAMEKVHGKLYGCAAL